MKKSLFVFFILSLGFSLVACSNIKQEKEVQETTKSSISSASLKEDEATTQNIEISSEKTIKIKKGKKAPAEEKQASTGSREGSREEYKEGNKKDNEEGKNSLQEEKHKRKESPLILERVPADTQLLSLEEVGQLLKEKKEKSLYGKKIALRGKLSEMEIPDGLSSSMITFCMEPKGDSSGYRYSYAPSDTVFDYIRYHGNIGEEYTFEIGTVQELRFDYSKTENIFNIYIDIEYDLDDTHNENFVSPPFISPSLVALAKNTDKGKVLRGEEAKAVEAKENTLKLSLDDLYEKLQQNDVQSLIGKNILVDLILDDDVNYYYYTTSPFSDVYVRSEKQYPLDIRYISTDEITQEKQFIRLEMPLSQEQHDYLAKEGKMGHHYTFELGVLEELQQLPDLAMSLEKSNILKVKTQSVLPNLLLPTISEEAKEAQKQGDQIKTKASSDAIEIKDLFRLAEKPEQLKELYGKTLVLSGTIDINASDSTMNIPYIHMKQDGNKPHFFGDHEVIQIYLGKNLASYFKKVQEKEREKQAKNNTYTPDSTIYQIEFPQVESIEISSPVGRHRYGTFITIATKDDVYPNLILP